MSWGSNLRDQIAADFRAAQRLRRGPADTSEDRPQVVLTDTPTRSDATERSGRILAPAIGCIENNPVDRNQS